MNMNGQESRFRENKMNPVPDADQHVESDAPIAEGYHPRIDPGQYDAVCFKAEKGISFGGRQNIFIRFRISGGKWDGTDLFMACTFPKGKMSLRHKYYQQWMLANGAPPAKGQRLSHKIFLHRMFHVLVRDTVKKHSNGRLMNDCVQYSVVDSILDSITGPIPEKMKRTMNGCK